MAMDTYTVNKTFNPWTQEMPMLAPDGTTTITGSVQSIIWLQHLMVTQSVSQGTQIGAATVLLIALLLLTKNEKRRNAIYKLNAIALVLVVLRAIFYCITLASPIYNWYRIQTYWYGGTGWAIAMSACGAMMSFFLIAVTIGSLFLQIRVVCINLCRRQRIIIDITSGCIAFITVGVYLAMTILDIDWNIVHLSTLSQWRYRRVAALNSAATIILVVYIAYSTTVFCTKLAFAIKSRRKMGLKQFGPMQIIFVMGCQTMLTPLIFTIVSYWGAKNSQMQTFVPTIVALSLPLSALWAAASTTNANAADSNKNGNRGLLIGASEPAAGAGASALSKPKADSISTAQTLVEGSASNNGGDSPNTDLEMQKLSGVMVNRGWGVAVD